MIYQADGSAATFLNNAHLSGGLSYQKNFQKNDNLFSVGLAKDALI